MVNNASAAAGCQADLGGGASIGRRRGRNSASPPASGSGEDKASVEEILLGQEVSSCSQYMPFSAPVLTLCCTYKGGMGWAFTGEKGAGGGRRQGVKAQRRRLSVHLCLPLTEEWPLSITILKLQWREKKYFVRGK